MADGLFTVLVFGVVMAFASFGAGMLPLAISLSQSQIRLLSTIGMGVLLGTSLIVIIPEGIETLYSVQPSPLAISLGHHRSPATAHIHGGVTRSDGGAGVEDRSLPLHFLWVRDKVSTIPGSSGPEDKNTPNPVKEDTSGSHSGSGHSHEGIPSPHKYVGLSLILGFVMMYLIDVLPSAAPRGNLRSQPYHISLDSLHSSLSPTNTSPTSDSSSTTSTTLGLVIHSAADGIALGASSTASSALSLFVFFAILLHKAPAAFGLTAVLLRAGLGKRTIRAHLMVFSAAAPIGAILTWFMVGLLGGGEGQGTVWWTGVCLLFSGGTFLYVAMHIMQEQAVNGEKVGLRDVAAAVGGMLVPLITQLTHGHAH